MKGNIGLKTLFYFPNRKVFNKSDFNKKMLNDFLKEVVVYTAGKPAEDIAVLLNTKKHVSEFIIAKKIDLTINQTRNILYKISDHGLVSSIRKKDKKKGLYTYFWKIEILKSLEFLKQVLLKQIEQVNTQVKSRETNQFYVCERCNIELTGEKALLCNFTCNECGDVFTIKDNSKLLRELKKNLNKCENKLALVKKEIEKEQEKIDKEKAKEAKKMEKEKAIAKKLAQEERAMKKKATTKKITKKKVIKKKPAKKKVRKKTVKKKAIKKKKVVKKKVTKKVIKKKIAKKGSKSKILVLSTKKREQKKKVVRRKK